MTNFNCLSLTGTTDKDPRYLAGVEIAFDWEFVLIGVGFSAPLHTYDIILPFRVLHLLLSLLLINFLGDSTVDYIVIPWLEAFDAPEVFCFFVVLDDA